MGEELGTVPPPNPRKFYWKIYFWAFFCGVRWFEQATSFFFACQNFSKSSLLKVFSRSTPVQQTHSYALYIYRQVLRKYVYSLQLGHFGITGCIFLIFLKMCFLELGHFGNTLHICKHYNVRKRSLYRPVTIMRATSRGFTEGIIFDHFVLIGPQWNEGIHILYCTNTSTNRPSRLRSKMYSLSSASKILMEICICIHRARQEKQTIIQITFCWNILRLIAIKNWNEIPENGEFQISLGN